MAFDLSISAEPWQAHLDSVHLAKPGLVPVIKGNGYGLGRARLAGQAQRMGAPMIAVGTYEEAAELLAVFPGDIQVLTPWRPFSLKVADPRVIHTLSRVEDIAGLAEQDCGARILLEAQTSMRRHGVPRGQLGQAAAELAKSSLLLEGFASHLPMAGQNLGEANSWCEALGGSGLKTKVFYVSHLTDTELTTLQAQHPQLTIRPRIGTSLWLGRLDTFEVTATVLDVHEISRGDRVGYRQDKIKKSGQVVVVAGGTSHGIGLEAPRAVSSVKDSAKAAAKGVLAASGRALSPFFVAQTQAWFVEPPHMQASMIFLPKNLEAPKVGDRLAAQVRYTIASFDSINLS
ncbi:MAG TPA: alanine racemase [Aeromicrobium sp.]|nr:alanine racemase [Aeromicrobium sp.]